MEKLPPKFPSESSPESPPGPVAFHEGKRSGRARREADKLLFINSVPLARVCGLDEVGRGPLAGPVCAGAVVLDLARPIQGLDDSKKLNPKRREELSELIRDRALGWAIAWASPEEVVELNIAKASLRAMSRAYSILAGASRGEGRSLGAGAFADLRLVVVDGLFVPDLTPNPDPDFAAVPLIKADSLVPSVSAASIIAKVARDAYMDAYAQKDPRYGFEKHKGYPTKAHWEALRRNGPCEIHRTTWVEKARNENWQDSR